MAAAPAATPTPAPSIAPPRPAPTWRPVPPPAPPRAPQTPRTRHWTEIPTQRTPSRRAAPTHGLTPAARGAVVAGGIGIPAVGGFVLGAGVDVRILLVLLALAGAGALIAGLVRLVLALNGGDSQ